MLLLKRCVAFRPFGDYETDGLRPFFLECFFPSVDIGLIVFFIFFGHGNGRDNERPCNLRDQRYERPVTEEQKNREYLAHIRPWGDVTVTCRRNGRHTEVNSIDPTPALDRAVEQRSAEHGQRDED